MIDITLHNTCAMAAVRMTQRSKFGSKRARDYLTWQHETALLFQSAMQLQGHDMIPRGIPLRVDITINHNHGIHRRDQDNELKGLEDSAQRVVFEDDRWIDCTHIERYRVDGDCSVRLQVEEWS